MINVIGFENEFKLITNNLINRKLNNSILLNGNKGIGKFFLIKKIIENYININIKSDKNNHHLSLLESNKHPNIKILQKKIDEKTNKFKNYITIDQVRELSNFFIETSIIENFPKFILIDSADDLNLNASNALLKILEEPKQNTYFFLISHLPSSLLPTIKSRCLKINLPCHNFENFKSILENREFSTNNEILRFFFDITGGAPGLCYDFDIDEILEIFEKLIYSIIDKNPFSETVNNTINFFASLDNEKFKLYLSLIKFILILFKKNKIGINLSNYYLSKNVLVIQKFSDNITYNIIDKKFDYLIKNQNDLFTFNLDKKIFMLNFFTEN